MKYSVKQFLLEELFQAETSEKQEDILDKRFVTETYTLPLYRGFNADLSTLKKENGFYVLSPNKSEQGMMWFTHPFIRGYDPVDYAKAHGSLFLTYPLKVKKHYELITYETGRQEKRLPEKILNLVDETKNQPFMCFYNEFCLELPAGWFFTYKNEKFIGTINHILVDPKMIEKID